MSVLNGMHAGEVVALGWTLLHFCWQSTAIAAVYMVIDRCISRASASVRYGLALAVLALLPLVAVATFVEQEHLVSHIQVDQQEFAGSQLGSMHAVLIEQLPAAAPAVGNGELWIAQHASLLLPWMDGLWLLGVLILALRATGGWWALQSLRRRAHSMVPQELRITFDKLAKRYQLSRRVVLRVSDEVISPMVFGVWRTVLLVPLSAAMSLPAEQLEAVLAHELAHVRRWDYLCNLLQTSVECLFFFQPAVWWVSRRAREFREVCCDEVAAEACSDPVVYAEALLHMEEQRAQQMRLAVALHGNERTLLNRVRRVMGEKAMEQKSMSGVRVAAVGIVLVGLYAVPHVAHGMKAEHGQTVVAAQPTTALNTEVASPAPTPVITPSVSVSPTVATPEPLPEPVTSALPAPNPLPHPNPSAMTMQDSSQQGGGMEYLKKMRDAGYPLDLNKDLDEIISLRSVGVTPEYAKSMAQAGLGTPTSHDLVTLKSVGVTPDYIASLKGSVLAPASFHDVITTRSMGITPEYARSLESLGLGKPSVHDVVSMKSVGITPEYVASLKGSVLAPENFHDLVTVKSLGITPEYARSLESLGLGKPTLHDVVSMKSVGVTPEYANAMASAGFSGMNAHELVAMRAQGMTPEYAKWLKATFPDADSHAMQQATVFHIDADFIAKAKASGFNSTSLDKLTKLKMSGLLN